MRSGLALSMARSMGTWATQSPHQTPLVTRTGMGRVKEAIRDRCWSVRATRGSNARQFSSCWGVAVAR